MKYTLYSFTKHFMLDFLEQIMRIQYLNIRFMFGRLYLVNKFTYTLELLKLFISLTYTIYMYIHCTISNI